MKNIKFISLRDLFKDGIFSEPMVSLSNSFELLALSTKLGWRLTLIIFGRQGRVSFRLKQIHNFFNYILLLNKRHGGKFVVSYLKCSQLAIQKAIGKQKLGSLRELDPSFAFPRLSSSGLPRYIPLSDRRAILGGSTSVIRFWLSLYSVYRIISIPGKLKLSTITDPFSGDLIRLQRVSLELRALARGSKGMFDKSFIRPDSGPLLLETSSPTNKVSWLGLFTDPFKLYDNNLGRTAEELMKVLGLTKLSTIWDTIISHRYMAEKTFRNYKFTKINLTNSVGQLSEKLEAAGKVRVFAMVDIWTQSILSPLHNMLSHFLASLPNDGTKDQVSSWKRAAQKSSCGFSYGYDLSAATDRLPLSLQISILTPIIGSRASELWGKFLIDRDYILKTKHLTGKPQSLTLRYAVGQPMGALSSFNMLAVTHHFLVQLAYRYTLPLEGRFSPSVGWWDKYEITGDDVVIFDHDVAKQYLTIMSDIGVPINESKSVCAKIPLVEYLKVTTLRMTNVSALSWKMLISQNSFMGRMSTMYTLLDRAYIGRHGLINWIKDVTCQTMNKGNVNFPLFGLLSKLYSSGKITLADLYCSLLDTKGSDSSLKSNLFKGKNEAYLSTVCSSLYAGKPTTLRKLTLKYTVPMIWIMDYLIHIYCKIKSPLVDTKIQDSGALAVSILTDILPNFIKVDLRSVQAFSDIKKYLISLRDSERWSETYYKNGKIPSDFIWEDTCPVLSNVQDVMIPNYESEEQLQFKEMKIAFAKILRDDVFLPLFVKLEPEMSTLLRPELESVFKMIDTIDRYKELESIFVRALNKVNNISPKAQKGKFSLKYFSLALKAISFHKKWVSDQAKLARPMIF